MCSIQSLCGLDLVLHLTRRKWERKQLLCILHYYFLSPLPFFHLNTLLSPTRYIAKSTLGHAPTTPIVPVSEGHEPLSFKSLFLSWRAKAADYVDPFASRPITPKVTSGSSGSGSKDSFAISSILKRRHVSSFF